MFRLGKYTRSFFRIVIYSLLLPLFLSQGWIDPAGNILDNVIAGVVLYMISWFSALIIASLINSQSGKE